MRVLIIEDEKVASDSLIESIKEVRPDYTVVKVLVSVEEAKSYFKTGTTINLIFSDIQLGDGLSFEIFKQINIDVPVIFCTAYDEYALEAFNANGIAYILKPFDVHAVQSAIHKFENLTNKHNNQISQLLNYFSNTPAQSNVKSILVYQKDKIIPVDTNDIAIMHLSNGIVKLCTFDNRTLLATQSLEDFEKLNIPHFFRANRQFLINRKAVKEALQHFNRKLLVSVVIKFSEEILISKEKVPAFFSWLSNT